MNKDNINNSNVPSNKGVGGSFMKQAAVLAAAGILVRILGFFYRLPLTDLIGDKGNGLYAAGYNIYNFFLIMSSAGLPVAISRMISVKLTLGEYTNAKKIFKVSMLAATCLSVFCAIVLGIFAKGFAAVLGFEDSYWCMYTLTPTIVIVGIMAVFRGYFQGFQTTVPTAISQLIEQVFNAFFSVYLAYLLVGFGVEYGAAGGTAGTGIGALAGLIVLITYYLKSRDSRNKAFNSDKKDYLIESNKTILKNLVAIAFPIIAGTAIFSMTNLVDMFMVSDRLRVAGFDQRSIEALYGQLNGKYVTLSTLPVSISAAIATAVIPSIAASLTRKEHKEVQSKIDTTLRLTMIISIPAAAGLGALGVQILAMLFPNYKDGGLLIQVGSFSVIFLALSQITTGVLQGIGKVNIPARNALIGAIFKIPVNYFLIAVEGINVIGAIIGTTVCYIICSLLNFRALVKATNVKPDYVGMLVKPAISAMFMALASIYSYKLFYMLMPSNTASTLLAIMVALLVYLVVMVLIGGFKEEDLKLMPAGGKLIALLKKFNRL